MSKTLEEIRKKLQALETKRAPGGNSDKSMYPHWNIPDGTSATVRFLPDGNEDNTFFWVEKQVIKLPFSGIKGHDEFKPVEVVVPCMEMWGGKNSCPILNEVRPWWNDKSLEEMARKYWIKRSYYAQGFVRQDPIKDGEVPENPIRKFMIGMQIFKIMKAALLDPDMENSPVDLINGTDFIISKTAKGGFSDYGTSKWARKESSITEEMQEAISQYGLVDLSTYLPKKPTPEGLNAIFEMFQASVDGELYDPERWSQFYRPYGFAAVNNSQSDDEEPAAPTRVAPRVSVAVPASAPTTVRPAPAVAPVAEADSDPSDGEDDAPAAAPAATTGDAPKKSPQEILAMLRNRNK